MAPSGWHNELTLSVHPSLHGCVCPSQKSLPGHDFAVNDQIVMKLGMVVCHIKKVCHMLKSWVTGNIFC